MKKSFKIPDLTFTSDRFRTLNSDKSDIPALGESIPVDLDGKLIKTQVVGLEFATDSNYVAIVILTDADKNVEA